MKQLSLVAVIFAVTLMQETSLFSMRATFNGKRARLDTLENKENVPANECAVHSPKRVKVDTALDMVDATLDVRDQSSTDKKYDDSLSNPKDLLRGWRVNSQVSNVFLVDLLRIAYAQQNTEMINTFNHLLAEAFYSAALEGSEEKVNYFIKEKLDVNSKTSEGQTPLIGAIIGGHMHIAELLLAHGADASIPDATGKFPIEFAAQYASMGIAGLLLRYKAQVPLKFLQF